MRVSDFEHYLFNLQGVFPATSMFYMAREEAYEQLKELSGEDFGYDAEKWEKWGRENNKLFAIK